MNKLFPLRKFLTLAVFAFILPLQSVQAGATLDKIAKTGSISIGFDPSVPFSYLDEQGKAVGYTIEICQKVVEAIKAQLKRPDIAINYKSMNVAARIPALQSGEIDLECGSMTNNAERRKILDFTMTTFIAEVRLLVHKNSPIKSTVDLTNKKVIVTKGTTSDEILKDLNKRLSLNITPVYFDTHPEAFATFEAKKADAYILDDILLYSRRATAKNPEDMVITRNPLSLEALAITMRKDDPEFKKIVDTEVSRIILQGEINTIYKRWFESPIPPKQINLNYKMSHLLRDTLKSPSDWAPN